MSLACLLLGCASQTLMPKEQAAAIQTQERALAPHSDAIQETIRQSGDLGALVFLDAGDGHLVVLPGNSPTEAWARYTASPPESSRTGRVSVPLVLSFVYRANVPKASETVTQVFLQQEQASRERQEALRTSLAALDSELRDEERRIAERIAAVERELSVSIGATRQDTQKSIAETREDLQKAVSSLAEELATARKFMLQTSQLAWLTHELNVENASGIRKVAAASQELTSTSARLADTIRQLSENLASELKELAKRIDDLQGAVSKIK